MLNLDLRARILLLWIRVIDLVLLDFLGASNLSAEFGHNSFGNYGILDQQFALQRAQDNIANFDCNATKVSVCGQSAESESTWI